MITEFGKLVRKARIDADITLLDMAKRLDVAPSFLSQIERGKKKVPLRLIGQIEELFKDHGICVDLRQAADLSNKSISIEHLDPTVRRILTGFARAPLTETDIQDLNKMLQRIEKKEKTE